MADEGGERTHRQRGEVGGEQVDQRGSGVQTLIGISRVSRLAAGEYHHAIDGVVEFEGTALRVGKPCELMILVFGTVEQRVSGIGNGIDRLARVQLRQRRAVMGLFITGDLNAKEGRQGIPR